jgi:hypothetical protein
LSTSATTAGPPEVDRPCAGATRDGVLALASGDATGAAAMVSAQPMMQMPVPTQPLMMPTNTMRDKVNTTVEAQPDAAARVVRAWLKEG